MISPLFIFCLIIGYFFVLVSVSYFFVKEDSNEVFFKANRNSPWYLVAFGMVGASLSGVTFISVPGWIESSKFHYFQVVLGYLAGYFIVAYLLLPLYYKNNVTSIYEYLSLRLGRRSHYAGAFFFFVSRVLGASFRLFLVAIVLQQFIFDAWNIPFEITVIISILFIWIYTQKGGIKTIVFTDTFQTSLMILSVILSIIYINQALNWSFFDFLTSSQLSNYNDVFVTDSILNRNHFLKSFIGGAFVTICMTGLDQDMMQKNLTCKTLHDAQKNMVVFSLILVIVTFIFLILGALLFTFAEKNDILIPILNGRENTDLLFPQIALNSNLDITLSITFLLGLIAAAYSSADSALTSLTTSFCIDFMDIEKKNLRTQKQIRFRTHILMSLILVIVIIIYKNYLSTSVIDSLLIIAGFTYGPLLGLFSFGIITNHKIHDNLSIIVCLLSVLIISLSEVIFVVFKSPFKCKLAVFLNMFVFNDTC